MSNYLRDRRLVSISECYYSMEGYKQDEEYGFCKIRQGTHLYGVEGFEYVRDWDSSTGYCRVKVLYLPDISRLSKEWQDYIVAISK